MKAPPSWTVIPQRFHLMTLGSQQMNFWETTNFQSIAKMTWFLQYLISESLILKVILCMQEDYLLHIYFCIKVPCIILLIFSIIHILVCVFNHVWLLVAPRTCSPQAVLSMEFSDQNIWGRCPFSPQEISPSQNQTCISCIICNGRLLLAPLVPPEGFPISW